MDELCELALPDASLYCKAKMIDNHDGISANNGTCAYTGLSTVSVLQHGVRKGMQCDRCERVCVC